MANVWQPAKEPGDVITDLNFQTAFLTEIPGIPIVGQPRTAAIALRTALMLLGAECWPRRRSQALAEF